MLYLAEVQKPKSGFNIGGRTKAELKLLAYQRSEQSWSAIPGEELIPAPDDAGNYHPGVLVLLDMNTNRQIQSPLKEAGKNLVGILQNLSRQIDKYKKESDEIESWQQSLSIQSQQLQLRQEEIYGRDEDLEFSRAEFNRLTMEAQALESTINNHAQQQVELADRWAKLEAREAQQSTGTAISAEQVAEIRTALHRSSANSGLSQQQLESTVTAISFQQDLLDGHVDKLRHQQQQVMETQLDLERQRQEIAAHQQQLQELQTALEQTQTEWEVQQHTLTMQQDYAQRLTARISLEQANYQQVYLMSQGGGLDPHTAGQVDLDQLAAMPIDELAAIVTALQTESERAVYFVGLEEDELKEKQATIDELQQQILTANEFDQLQLAAELADEQDGYDMLNQTLDGQRQTIRERQAFLQVHNRVLRQRQGAPLETANGAIEWTAVLNLLDRQRQVQQSELAQVAAEIELIQVNLGPVQAQLEQQVTAYGTAAASGQQLEARYQATQQVATELVAKIELYQEMIQPLQRHIDTFKEQLGGLASTAGDSVSQQDMAQIESLLHNLVHGAVVAG